MSGGLVRRGVGLAWIGSLASIALLVGCAPRETAPDRAERSRRPDVVLVVIDTLRAGNLAHAGYERATSPRLDQFAASSVRFSSAVAVGGNTPTVMAALMTGHLPFFDWGESWDDTTMFGMRRFYRQAGERGLPQSLPVLPEALRAAGYRTAGVVTNPYLKSVFHFDRGFERWHEVFAGEQPGSGADVSSRAKEILAEWDGEANDAPRFLYLHYMDVHGPYLPPDQGSCFGVARMERVEETRRFDTWMNQSVSRAELDALRPQMLALYDCAIQSADASIGEVLDALERGGRWDSTVVAVTADHGEEFLEHGATTHPGDLYEEIVRVPLLLRVPGAPPRVIDDLVRNFDLMPTLLDLAGAHPLPADLEASSLLPLLERRVETMGLDVYASFPWRRMYRDREHKIIQSIKGRVEVFDLTADPSEAENLATAEVAAAISRTLEARLAEKVAALAPGSAAAAAGGPLATPSLSPADAPGAVDSDTRRQLRALGYVR